jgi:ribosomal protein S14
MCRINDPRWRETVFEHGTDADWKNGPAARSFTADAHDCIMSGSKRTYRIQVCRAKMRDMASSPRILNTQTGTVRRPKLSQKSPVAVHHRSACSGVKALRNTSAARRQAAKLCYRFGPLTPSARSANLIAGDGTKNGFPAPNKELATPKNDP